MAFDGKFPSFSRFLPFSLKCKSVPAWNVAINESLLVFHDVGMWCMYLLDKYIVSLIYARNRVHDNKNVGNSCNKKKVSGAISIKWWKNLWLNFFRAMSRCSRIKKLKSPKIHLEPLPPPYQSTYQISIL